MDGKSSILTVSAFSMTCIFLADIFNARSFSPWDLETATIRSAKRIMALSR
jgi:hypothetical protein